MAAMKVIRKGDRVRYRDAFGVWRETTAASGIEGTHGIDPATGKYKKIHSFPVVYLNSRTPEYGPVAWPVEDVELLS
jgi:hypothetical protein